MPPPNDNVLRTVADELLELVKKDKKISVEDAANKLKMPAASVQALVDFLVEERVFGIEYKFTTPYVYLYKDSIGQIKIREKGFMGDLITKEQFYKKAKEKKIPYEYIEGIWRKYLQENLVSIREEFFGKAREKKVPEGSIQELWNKYISYL